MTFQKNIDQAAMSASAQAFASQPPVLSGARDNIGDIVGNLAFNGVTDDRQPEFHGQGTPGDMLVIKNNGIEIGRANVGTDGTWRCTPSTDLVPGTHAITVAVRDASGVEGPPSAAFNFEIDVIPPDASKLFIRGFSDTSGSITGNVSSGASTDETRPLLSGISTGVPGHTVTVMVKDASGIREVGQAVIGEGGLWTLQVEQPLAAGPNTLMLVERDMAGNETMPTDRYLVNVSTDKPTAPVIESVLDDVGTPHLLQPGEETNDARPTLSGTAQAGHTVKIYDGATLLGTAVADDSGNWSFTPKADLADGAHGITATSTSPLGQTSDASGLWSFVVDTVPPEQTASLIDIGKDSGTSADDYLTNDGSAGRLLQGTLSAALAKGETLQVSTDGGTTWKAAFVSGAAWSAQDSASHAGDWMVQTRVVDAAGNVGAVKSQAVTLDTVAPVAPTSVAVSGSTVTVTFEKAGVQIGDRISLINGDNRLEYILTAADVLAGKATIAASISASSSVAAGIVDKGGTFPPT